MINIPPVLNFVYLNIVLKNNNKYQNKRHLLHLNADYCYYKHGVTIIYKFIFFIITCPGAARLILKKSNITLHHREFRLKLIHSPEIEFTKTFCINSFLPLTLQHGPWKSSATVIQNYYFIHKLDFLRSFSSFNTYTCILHIQNKVL